MTTPNTTLPTPAVAHDSSRNQQERRSGLPRGLQRLIALIRKESTQLMRDRRSLIYVLALPLIQLFLFGYAVSLTVYHLPTAIVDQSNDARSRNYIQALVNSQYFDITLRLQSEEEAITAIDHGDAKVGIVIPPNFATDTDLGKGNVLVLLDGSDSFSVQSGYGAASTISQNYSLNLTTEKIRRMGGNAAAITDMPINTATRVLYNPDLREIWFILPALMGLILQTLAVGQAALVVVKDREVGTVEQILVTPTRPLELVLSKMIPQLVLSLITMGAVMGLGVVWFGVPFQGSILLYAAMVVLFAVCSLGLGLFISTRARTQKQAQQMALMVMMFSTLLTGMIYPRNSMPIIPQLIGNLFPLTYFIRISRGIMTKGVGLSFVWTDAVTLIFYAVVIIVIASRNFKNRLD
jgi:ABC-2 type transport system permease protein